MSEYETKLQQLENEAVDDLRRLCRACWKEWTQNIPFVAVHVNQEIGKRAAKLLTLHARDHRHHVRQAQYALIGAHYCANEDVPQVYWHGLFPNRLRAEIVVLDLVAEDKGYLGWTEYRKNARTEAERDEVARHGKDVLQKLREHGCLEDELGGDVLRIVEVEWMNDAAQAQLDEISRRIQERQKEYRHDGYRCECCEGWYPWLENMVLDLTIALHEEAK